MSSVHPARYRANQFFVALKAYLPTWAGGFGGHLSGADAALVNAILSTTAQQRLFERMSPNDQRHAIAVARSLQEAGVTDLALMQAALLHDVAKSLGQPIIHRVVIVLLHTFWPSMLQKLCHTTAGLSAIGWWRRPFVIHAHHPTIGASWAKEAGCEPLALDLIAHHQDKLNTVPATEQKLLAALQKADDLN